MLVSSYEINIEKIKINNKERAQAGFQNISIFSCQYHEKSSTIQASLIIPVPQLRTVTIYKV